MEYTLIKAENKDIDRLIEYKMNNIFAYANNLKKSEIDEIKEYVNKSTIRDLNEYMIIKFENKIIGSILIKKYIDKETKEQYDLLDEIYIEKEYRNMGIGTSIIKNVLENIKEIYLWVYKENKEAIKLYTKLQFKIYRETKERYMMKYNHF